MRKLAHAVVAIIIVSWGQIWAINPHIDAVETPTAVTLPQAHYATSFWGYEDGGILSKAMLGLHERVNLGVAFDFENAIGKEKAQMNVPGVLARVKFTDGWGRFPILIAAGYGTFHMGENGKVPGTNRNPYNRLIFGPYVTVTKPIFLFSGEQHIHWGVRTPLQPYAEPDDTSTFVAFDFPMGRFVPMVELERLYFDANRADRVLFNAGLRFNAVKNLALEFNIVTGFNQRPNRILGIEYMNSF